MQKKKNSSICYTVEWSILNPLISTIIYCNYSIPFYTPTIILPQ